MTERYEHFLDTASAAADTAADIIRSYFRASNTISGAEHKADNSPVTIADKKAEAAIREIISSEYPTHLVIGEEYGSALSPSGGTEYIWVIDPIDGTKNFMTGQPLFGIMIALLHRGVPVVGLVNNPITNEKFCALYGKNATLNGATISASPPAEGIELDNAILSTTSPFLFSKDKISLYNKLQNSVRYAIYGSDCYAYMMLACGYIDIIVESELKLHDVAALVPIVESAGGIITDWNGNKLCFTSALSAPTSDSSNNTFDILACRCPSLHSKAVSILTDI